MIIVTHDERIAAMADRIIQMKDGRVYRNYNYCRRDF